MGGRVVVLPRYASAEHTELASVSGLPVSPQHIIFAVASLPQAVHLVSPVDDHPKDCPTAQSSQQALLPQELFLAFRFSSRFSHCIKCSLCATSHCDGAPTPQTKKDALQQMQDQQQIKTKEAMTRFRSPSDGEVLVPQRGRQHE